jgi:intracellular protein transport protein USO1
LRKEAADAKDEAKSSKEELESMLLVMGDIEAKRDGYRAKVKDLGGEVTEDEESEDGDEEDEDEDEDEGGGDSDVD